MHTTATFNDPFDCRVLLRNDATFEEWLAYFRNSLPALLRGASKTEIETRAQAAALQSLNPEIFAKVVARRQRDVHGCGVLCLSEEPDDILMWSHYSAGHTGVCFEFAHLNEPFLGRCQPVKYSTELPRIGALTTTPMEQIEAFILTKPIDWAYEKEWRAIEFETGPGLYEFDSRLLTGMIFGARIAPVHRNQLLGWAGMRNPPLAIRQAVVADDEYSLQLSPASSSPVRGQD